ncbi:MAG: flavin reductase family protein [Saprospiraceae bacterium]|nr:flavin reductase family protein [Saprospiraceae bacterium]
MLKIVPGTIPTADFHQYLLGAVAPRPIAFASTLDKNGLPNLAPYSFFNCFSSNPPILVFSSNRKVADNTTKDTLQNVIETGEVVINVVTYNIVRQAAIASIEYPPEVSEFEKAGFTPITSELIKPFRVKESPIHMECKVNQIIPLGEQGGAGHLIICEILQMHIDEAILDEKGRIDPHKIDLMGRMGRAFYVRASGEAVHTIFQPYNVLGIGFDQLPQGIRHSKILTGNDLGQLAALTAAPTMESVLDLKNDPYILQLLQSENPLEELHRCAQKELAKENVDLAARIVWLSEQL